MSMKPTSKISDCLRIIQSGQLSPVSISHRLLQGHLKFRQECPEGCGNCRLTFLLNLFQLIFKSLPFHFANPGVDTPLARVKIPAT